MISLGYTHHDRPNRLTAPYFFFRGYKKNKMHYRRAIYVWYLLLTDFCRGCYWDCEKYTPNVMKIEAILCVPTETKRRDTNYYIQTFHNDTQMKPETHRNCTFDSKFKKLVCFKSVSDENYEVARTELVGVVGNRTEAVNGTRDFISTTMTLKECLYHDIKDFTIKETENDSELRLSWRTYGWDREKFIKNIIISRDEIPVQSLGGDVQEFIVKDLSKCTKYKLCIETPSIDFLSRNNKETEILDNQCQIVTTKCPDEEESEPILNLIEILVIVMLFIITSLIATLIVYHFANKRKVGTSVEQYQDNVTEETSTVTDDRNLEISIMVPSVPTYKADHTYADARLLIR